MTENKAEHFVGNSRSESLELLKLRRNARLGQTAMISNEVGATPGPEFRASRSEIKTVALWFCDTNDILPRRRVS